MIVPTTETEVVFFCFFFYSAVKVAPSDLVAQPYPLDCSLFLSLAHPDIGEVFDYLVAHGRMKEKEARAKFRQVSLCLL